MADTRSKINGPQSAISKLNPKSDGSTANIVEQNVAKLKEVFPDVVTEGKIDFDALREALGDYIDDRQERYSFTWNGKSLAKRIAQTPSTGSRESQTHDTISSWTCVTPILKSRQNLWISQHVHSFNSKVR